MTPTTRLHALSGSLALALICTFWLSTVLTETFGGPAAIATVKTLILYGFALLIPAMAVTGLSGNRLGRGWRLPLVQVKRKRIAIAAANGLLVLVPSAFFLAARAQSGQFDTLFYAVQALELCAGALNITLLARNMRDGLALRRRQA